MVKTKKAGGKAKRANGVCGGGGDGGGGDGDDGATPVATRVTPVHAVGVEVEGSLAEESKEPPRGTATLHGREHEVSISLVTDGKGKASGVQVSVLNLRTGDTFERVVEEDEVLADGTAADEAASEQGSIFTGMVPPTLKELHAFAGGWIGARQWSDDSARARARLAPLEGSDVTRSTSRPTQPSLTLLFHAKEFLTDAINEEAGEPPVMPPATTMTCSSRELESLPVGTLRRQFGDEESEEEKTLVLKAHSGQELTSEEKAKVRGIMERRQRASQGPQQPSGRRLFDKSPQQPRSADGSTASSCFEGDMSMPTGFERKFVINIEVTVGAGWSAVSFGVHLDIPQRSRASADEKQAIALRSLTEEFQQKIGAMADVYKGEMRQLSRRLDLMSLQVIHSTSC